ncbi:MAG: hypothetical protein ACYC2T_09020 [Bacillota bacterium]
MNKLQIDNAQDDLKFIRRIIENTSASFVPFGRIFIFWGLLYIVVQIGATLIDRATGLFHRMPMLNQLLLPTFLLIAFLAFYRETKKLPLLGLSKQVMYIWLYIILLNFLIMVIDQINPELIIFSFSIGILSTYILTHFRFLVWMFIIYLLIGVAYLFPFASFTTIYILHGIYPVTFLIFGFYLIFTKSPRSI